MSSHNIKHKQLTKEQEVLVYRMIYGPFKKEWFDEFGVLENTNVQIAKRLGMTKSVITRCINIAVDNRTLYFDCLINANTPSEIVEHKMKLYDQKQLKI